MAAGERASFPYLDGLPAPATSRAAQPAPETEPAPATTSWPAQQGDLYGEFINFRSLQHAPVNEQGVVFLFGMVARDLGFVIERVQIATPDCEAKRRLKGGRGYERVRIEFEFRSSNFNHQPEGCDLIVRWEHNWTECPSTCWNCGRPSAPSRTRPARHIAASNTLTRHRHR